MRQISLSFICALAIFSCKKNDNPNGVLPTKFKFTANSYSNEWNASLAVNAHFGAVIRKESQSGLSGYGLAATDSTAPSQNSILYLMMETNSPLAVTTYIRTTSSSTNNFPDEGRQINSALNHYWPSSVGDFTSVTITSIHNGYADGSFTAKMTQLTNSSPIVVNVNGTFSNVKILE